MLAITYKTPMIEADVTSTGSPLQRETVLMAIDPGGSTGVAFKISANYHTCTINEPKELWDLIKNFKPDRIAFESFYTGGQVDRNMIHTIELVGSIHGICYVLGIPFHGQQPQARKSFILDARKILKTEGGHTQHEVDALAHLLCLEYRANRGML
jgi:hypothetical protein